MSRKIVMKLENGAPITIIGPTRPHLPASTYERIRLCWELVQSVRGAPDRWELRISPQTPIGGGFGRSLRAALLGLNYKMARRISGSPTSFLLENFSDPSAVKVYNRKQR